ncbi:MAG: DUF3015 domain-containing protein [Pseudomonadaceae bacterium]|nr:DUF3015 domain-containing protein [Pseudomonadaceae bacterium]
MLRRTLLIIAVACMPATAFAAEGKAPGSGPNPYSECGIGAAIFQDVTWAAATSNVIWDLGVTAIISAISSPETCNARKVATARLILETLPSLEQDIAVGGGAHLTALNETMLCDSSVQTDLNAQLRGAYAQVVQEASYAQKSRYEKASALYGNVKEVVDASQGACDVIL